MYGLDLFSGIGGITKALEGYVQPVAYCESDRYCQAVLLNHMADGTLPTAPMADDIRSLVGDDLPMPIDIIYGGFPCQDISCAGRREGLEGKRSGLFFEIMRLAGEVRPRFIFLENVADIVDRGGVRVIAELTALGYDTRWITLSASFVGASHLRERWWLLANAKRDGVQGRPLKGAQREIKTRDEQLPRLLFPRIEDAVSVARVWRTDHGVSTRMDARRNMGIGNAVVPAQAREAFERLMGLK